MEPGSSCEKWPRPNVYVRSLVLGETVAAGRGGGGGPGQAVQHLLAGGEELGQPPLGGKIRGVVCHLLALGKSL